MEACRPTAYEAVVFLCAELALRRESDVYASTEVFKAALALVIDDLRSLDPHLTFSQLFDLAPVAMSDVILRDHVPTYVFRFQGAQDDRVRLCGSLPLSVREALSARVEAFGQTLMPRPTTASLPAAAK